MKSLIAAFCLTLLLVHLLLTLEKLIFNKYFSQSKKENLLEINLKRNLKKEKSS